jgi:hypothetical protein
MKIAAKMKMTHMVSPFEQVIGNLEGIGRRNEI